MNNSRLKMKITPCVDDTVWAYLHNEGAKTRLDQRRNRKFPRARNIPNAMAFLREHDLCKCTQMYSQVQSEKAKTDKCLDNKCPGIVHEFFLRNSLSSVLKSISHVLRSEKKRNQTHMLKHKLVRAESAITTVSRSESELRETGFLTSFFRTHRDKDTPPVFAYTTSDLVPDKIKFRFHALNELATTAVFPTTKLKQPNRIDSRVNNAGFFGFYDQINPQTKDDNWFECIR